MSIAFDVRGGSLLRFRCPEHGAFSDYIPFAYLADGTSPPGAFYYGCPARYARLTAKPAPKIGIDAVEYFVLVNDGLWICDLDSPWVRTTEDDDPGDEQ